MEGEGVAYLTLVTSHPRATADLHIRDPRKPLPPATTIRFFAACAMSEAAVIGLLSGGD